MPNGKRNKTRVLVPAITAALVLMMATPAMFSTGAFAIDPETTTKNRGMHFVGDPQLTVNKETEDGAVTASLSATGEIAGAGTGGTATLSAIAVIKTGCITNQPEGNPDAGQNEPPGLETTTEEVSGSESFTTEQGRGTFSVTTNEVTTGDFDCPSAQQTEFSSITFTDITLTIESDEGKEITATYADQDP